MSDHFKLSASNPGLSLTATKSDLDFLDEKLKLSSDFTHLKLKLTGSDDDMEFVKAIRNHSSMPFCVDINQGCKNKEQAIVLIQALEEMDCYLVEQPLKDFDHEGHYWLKQRVQIPIIADESIRTYEELEKYHEAYSGINIKVMKSGGLLQAQKMLQFSPSTSSNAAFIKVLGCMSESSLGVATAAVLASQADIADLDAPYINANDPFEGFQIHKGRIKSYEEVRLRKGFKL
jgi:L-alanine-DL-glutamate epimerase-like enolase superfamily enzyme